MNSPNQPAEPLNNVALESAALGLRMTLTPEEGIEARAKFLEILRNSPLAVPTVSPAPTGPDGALLPNSEISLLVVNTAEGVSGVPVFTTLGGLRAALPQVENGMFLRGAEISSILGNSGHKLFVDGPDMHVEVEQTELQQMAFITQQQAELQQQAAQRNDRLAEALAALGADGSPAHHEEVVRAFLEGFCRYPALAESDGDAEALVLSQEAPPGGAPAQEVALMTVEGALPAFTSDEAVLAWSSVPRPVLPLPGQMVVQLATQAEVTSILLDPGSPNARTLQVQHGQVSLE